MVSLNSFIWTLANIFKKAIAREILYKETTEFQTKREKRNGDSISTKLFTSILEDIFRKLDWNNIDGYT